MWIQQPQIIQTFWYGDSIRKTILLSEATIDLNDILYNNISYNEQIPLSRIKQFIIIFF